MLSSKGVENAKDFSANEAVTRLGISFLADQSKKSVYKASAMRQGATLSTQLYSELTATSPQPSPSGEGASQTGGENGNQGGNENQGGGGNQGTTNPPSGGGGGNEND